jgi:hypothetical protein
MEYLHLAFRNSHIVLPVSVSAIKAQLRYRKFIRAPAGRSTSEIFMDVYSKQIWSGGSGLGSHNALIVEPYITSIARFAETFSSPLDVVDLGCGDFAVGSALRPLFNRYIAGDIVPDVIAQNQKRYSDLDVDFRVIDFAVDDLPPGDVVFVRQVFQHLSNDEIGRAVARLRETYPKLVLTEHLPLATDFVPNIDIQTGPGIRLAINSGVDITRAPFEVPIANATVLCEVTLEKIAADGSPPSRYRTTLYEF